MRITLNFLLNSWSLILINKYKSIIYRVKIKKVKRLSSISGLIQIFLVLNKGSWVNTKDKLDQLSPSICLQNQNSLHQVVQEIVSLIKYSRLKANLKPSRFIRTGGEQVTFIFGLFIQRLKDSDFNYYVNEWSHNSSLLP